MPNEVIVRTSQELRSDRKLQREAARLAALSGVAGAGKDILVAALQSPATSMVLGVAAVGALNKAGLINNVDRGLLSATIISSEFLKSFQLVKIGKE